MTPSTKPSANWFELQKSLVRNGHPRKRQKIEPGASLPDKPFGFPRGNLPLPPPRHESNSPNEDIDLQTTEMKNGESIATLRRMVLGKLQYTTSQTAPGKYLALDCEMVGVGIKGSESSLARVSIVNYAGAIILDVFVRQREKVVDYRTQWSGVRNTDLTGSAKPFKEVQQTVAELVKDRMLVGHAIYNDLKALLLSHPSPQIRDTQSLSYKHGVVKSRRPALRVLVKQELGITIQDGEHSSVTDARATMALFRLYKKQWESSFRPHRALAHQQSNSKDDNGPAGKAEATTPIPSSHHSCKKRGHAESSESDDTADEGTQAPIPLLRARSPSSSSASHIRASTQNTPAATSKQSKLQPSVDSTHRPKISSGISTVTWRAGGTKEVRQKGIQKWHGGERCSVVGKHGDKTGKAGEKWWKSLGGRKKGSIKL